MKNQENTQASKILRQVIVTGLYLALLMPFVYMRTTIFPFVVAKFIYFQILIEVLAVAYILLAIISPAYRPKKSLVWWLMLLHLGAWIVSGFLSESPMRSFFGNFERMSGVFNYAHFVAYFVILASVMRTKKSWVAYLITGLVIATGQACLGIAQFYATTSILFAEPHGRIWGTLGNYIYLAGYTMTHVFLALFVLPHIKRKELRFWIWIMIAINAFAFFLAQTRGAYMGMAVGIVVSLLYVVWMNREKKYIRNVIIGALIVVGITATWTATNNTTVYRVPVLRIFKHITINEGTTRLIAWRIALEGFLKHPVFGWGPDTYYFVFNQLYKPESLLHSYYETWFDRSHNIFLDELATTGAVGMITYLGLAAALFLGVHEIKKKHQLNTMSVAALYGLLTSYYVSNVFVFDNAASFMLFALMAALITSFHEGFNEEAGDDEEQTRSLPVTPAIVLVMAAIVSIYLYSVKPFMLANELLMAESVAQSGVVTALPLYKKAYERGGPLSDEIVAGLLRVATEQSSSQPDLLKNHFTEMQEIYIFSQELIKSRPQDVYTWLTLGQLATNMGSVDQRYFADAEEYFKKAVALSPGRQQIYYSWVKEKVMAQDIPGAFALLDTVEKLEPLVPDTYWYRGLINSDIGKMDEALKWMLVAFNNSPEHRYVWKNVREPLMVAQLLDKAGRYKEVPQFLEEALTLSADDKDILMALAQSYARINDVENSRKYVLRILELDPHNQAALNFLRLFVPTH